MNKKEPNPVKNFPDIEPNISLNIPDHYLQSFSEGGPITSGSTSQSVHTYHLTTHHHRAVWDLVVEDMKIRYAIGNEKYKSRLQPHNGRYPLRDAYQEALDLAVYLRQELFERYGE